MASMSWNLLLTLLSLDCLLSEAAKRGLTLGGNHVCDDLALFGKVKPWFYNWRSWPTGPDYASCAGAHDSGYIPMIWSGAGVDTTNITAGEALLGFNEPNMPSQSNMKPEDAAALWPQLVKRAASLGITRIGSPAPSAHSPSHVDAKQWLDAFFAACKGCQVDFIALHFYGCNANTLKHFLLDVHSRYDLPIWLTEFNCGDGMRNATALAHMKYMRGALPLLESLDFVERYAWMSARNGKIPGSSLIHPGSGTLTDLGKFYRDFSADVEMAGNFTLHV
eukprot:TRINITY_DN18842_c0_g1_i1.p1 TRINITY_DN18842_c0_g1~~TRINITY_DN18842_c0_g1_i1.p1  ORF type:complete len:278 (-),score=43.00 TRINITY_DN18842_c0_g1_i1:71-904(-)